MNKYINDRLVHLTDLAGRTSQYLNHHPEDEAASARLAGAERERNQLLRSSIQIERAAA